MRLVLGSLAMALLVAGCAPAYRPALPPFEEKASGSYLPTEDDRTEILIRLTDYWEALRRAQWEDANAFRTLDFQESLPFWSWRQGQVADFGAPRRLTKLHWLKDSGRMPGPELFAVTEWRAGPDEAPFAWGRLVWRLELRDEFLIQSEEVKVFKRRAGG